MDPSPSPSSLFYGFKAFGARVIDSVSCARHGEAFHIHIHALIALVQILYSGFQVLASAALSVGVSRYVFPVYRNLLAFLFLAPFAFFLERRQRPPLTLIKLSQFLLCGLVGVCINQSLYLAGLYYTSATCASAVQNLVPVFTFTISACLGIEKIRIKRTEGQAKTLGIILCVTGAICIAFYQGPAVIAGDDDDEDDGAMLNRGLNKLNSSSFLSFQLGVLCLLGNCLTWAIWFILQTPVVRDYPAHLSMTTFTYALGALQLAIIAVCIERDLSVWASTFYSDIPAVVYGGLVASGVAMTLQGWCADRGGPVLVAAYQPLQTIIVAILSSLFLKETFYLGSLIGGFLIVVGLYFVVWGKSRERRIIKEMESAAGIGCNAPPSICSVKIREALQDPLLCDGNATNERTSE